MTTPPASATTAPVPPVSPHSPDERRPTRPTRPIEPTPPAGRRRIAGLATALLLFALGGTACLPTTIPPGAGNVVVFDIDGTLTADELSDAAQPDATAAVNGYLAKEYDVVYLTARWNVLADSTRTWLRDHGFPERPLYTAPSLLISDADKVTFKTGVLQDLKGAGRTLRYAYGDSSSDFAAYANAGIPSSKVFALRRASATACQPGVYAACLVGYTAHLPYIGSVPAV